MRPEGGDGIEVADAKLLSAVDSPVVDWREKVVMPLPTFQVGSVSISRENKVIRAERDSAGRWRLRAPVTAPANPAKVESLIAALSSLRVVDGEKGFVANNVKDFTPFGLAAPRVTVELTPTRPGEETLVLRVGKPVADQPDRVYVRQGDQDDVVIVDAKALSEVPSDAIALRSQQVADIDPAAVTKIQIQARGDTFALEKGPTAWELTSPRKAKADVVSVRSFVSGMSSLQTSEFLEPKQVNKPELDPPIMTIQIWEERSPSRTAASSADPVVVLRIGKHDALRKTVYARLENDHAILALPDTILEVLPKNALAFRDLAILSVNPADVRKLTVVRAGRTDMMEPSTGGEPNRWRLRQPVEAPADTRSVTRALAVLSNLRADQLITQTSRNQQAKMLRPRSSPCSKSPGDTDQTSSAQDRFAGAARRPTTLCTAIDSRMGPFVFAQSRRRRSNPLKPSFAITSCCRFRRPRPSGWSCCGPVAARVRPYSSAPIAASAKGPVRMGRRAIFRYAAGLDQSRTNGAS